MEETKELQTTYKIFRYLIYLSLIVEFFEYAINPELLDYWGGILCDIHGRIKRWYIYQDGNLIWSKIATFILICITCIGTRNKKHLEFDARHQVFYPLFGGLVIIILSIWLYGQSMGMKFPEYGYEILYDQFELLVVYGCVNHWHHMYTCSP